MKLATLLLALLGWAAPLGTALAAGEKEWQIAARTGAGTFSVDGRSSWGFVAALDLEYGLSDSWALRTSILTSLHSVDPAGDTDTRPKGKLLTAGAFAGLTYTIDILRLVPYAALQFGALRLDGAVVAPRFVLASALGIGADYYVTRVWTSGAFFQYLFDPIDLFSDPFNLGRSPYGFSVTLRVSRIF